MLPETIVQSPARSTFSGLAWTQPAGQPSAQFVATDHSPSAGDCRRTRFSALTSTRRGVVSVIWSVVVADEALPAAKVIAATSA